MNETSTWFYNHLQSSGEDLIWSAQQVRSDRWQLDPPQPLGEWSAARHLFHMAFYEETLALPSMRQWLGSPLPNLQDDDEEGTWQALPDRGIQAMTTRFQTVRQAQIDLIPLLDESAWEQIQSTVWAPFPLRWVVSKTFQHTTEHINDILRLALFWDRFKK
jgi:hypothetical protein